MVFSGGRLFLGGGHVITTSFSIARTNLSEIETNEDVSALQRGAATVLKNTLASGVTEGFVQGTNLVGQAGVVSTGAYVTRQGAIGAAGVIKSVGAKLASRGAFDAASFVGKQAVTTPNLPAGVRAALVVDGKVYVARFHLQAWKLAGKKGVEQFYGFAEIDAAGKVLRLIK